MWTRSLSIRALLLLPLSLLASEPTAWQKHFSEIKERGVVFHRLGDAIRPGSKEALELLSLWNVEDNRLHARSILTYPKPIPQSLKDQNRFRAEVLAGLVCYLATEPAERKGALKKRAAELKVPFTSATPLRMLLEYHLASQILDEELREEVVYYRASLKSQLRDWARELKAADHLNDPPPRFGKLDPEKIAEFFPSKVVEEEVATTEETPEEVSNIVEPPLTLPEAPEVRKHGKAGVLVTFHGSRSETAWVWGRIGEMRPALIKFHDVTKFQKISKDDKSFVLAIEIKKKGQSPEEIEEDEQGLQRHLGFFQEDLVNNRLGLQVSRLSEVPAEALETKEEAPPALQPRRTNEPETHYSYPGEAPETAAAFENATRTEKPVLLFISGRTCRYCVKVDDLLATDEISRRLAFFEKVKLFHEDNEALAKEFVNEYSEKEGVPLLVFFKWNPKQKGAMLWKSILGVPTRQRLIEVMDWARGE